MIRTDKRSINKRRIGNKTTWISKTLLSLAAKKPQHKYALPQVCPAQPDPTGHHLGVGMNLFLWEETEKDSQEDVSRERKKKAYK